MIEKELTNWNENSKEPILLCAINARYNHTNIAVRSINWYIKERFDCTIDFAEWTINQPIGAILRGISEKCITLKSSQNVKPLILFSVYIWNVEITFRVIRELKKILPDCVIGAGGPEVSYKAKQSFAEVPELDIIISGEGEQASLELVEVWQKYHMSTFAKSALYGSYFNKSTFLNEVSKIPSMYVSKPVLRFGGIRKPFDTLAMLPFPYPYLGDTAHREPSNPLYDDPLNKIYYYESSRGCPFNCAYCISSIDKMVRFMPLERVYKDIQHFMDAGVLLVKFVDRTFNIDSNRYIKIWQYIYDHHNGKTMFHFEIAAEQFSDESLDFLQKIPANMMQFEIGIQSTNKATLKAIHRNENWDKLVSIVKRIPRTIQKHLDLIAGLPYEDLSTFGKSFNNVLSLHPDVLQLGFLKVLSGTEMCEYEGQMGWQWMSCPPYEILKTPVLSYQDLMFLKDIEVLLDVFWNTHNFTKFMSAISQVTAYYSSGLFAFFSDLVRWCRKQKLLEAPHRALFWFEQIDLFLKTWNGILDNSIYKLLHELLRFDFITMGKTSGFPIWCEHNYNKEEHRSALNAYDSVNENKVLQTGLLSKSQELRKKRRPSSRVAYAHSEFDTFLINPLEWELHKDSCMATLLHNQVQIIKSCENNKSDLSSTKILFLYPNPVPGQQRQSCKFFKCN